MKWVGKHSDIPQSLFISGESFQIVGASAQGASHVANDKVCQDALMACEHYYRGKPMVLAAVSDGHGGDKYILSDIGSHLAVKAFYDVATEYGRWIISQQPSEDEKNREFEKRFIRAYMHLWHQLIKKNFEQEKRQKDYDNKVSIATLYGCTLSFVFICDNEVYAGQIGDGAVYHYDKGMRDIIAVVSSIDSDAIGLSTDSLSSSNAIYRYNYKRFTLSPSAKGILLISTDGLLDSLQEDIKVVLKDIYNKKQIYGYEWLKKIWGIQLAKWSYNGVGDDMAAIALFYGKEDRKPTSEIKNKQISSKKSDTGINNKEKECKDSNLKNDQENKSNIIKKTIKLLTSSLENKKTSSKEGDKYNE